MRDNYYSFVVLLVAIGVCTSRYEDDVVVDVVVVVVVFFVFLCFCVFVVVVGKRSAVQTVQVPDTTI